MLESDASASLATTRATADAPDLMLIYLRRRAEAEETFRAATRRAWLTHCKGWANGLADAGSRDKMHEMHALADAFGIRLRARCPSLRRLSRSCATCSPTPPRDRRMRAYTTRPWARTT